MPFFRLLSEFRLFPTFQLFFFFFFCACIVCVTTMRVNWWLSGQFWLRKSSSSSPRKSSSPWTPTQGAAPGPRWGLCPRSPDTFLLFWTVLVASLNGSLKRFIWLVNFIEAIFINSQSEIYFTLWAFTYCLLQASSDWCWLAVDGVSAVLLQTLPSCNGGAWFQQTANSIHELSRYP